MDTSLHFPLFDNEFPDLNRFILELVKAYHSGGMRSWDNLEKRVKDFFTPERMEQMETLAPGWGKMASYSEGITLTHVTCVFLGMFLLEEFQTLSTDQQQIAKWIILFHDIDKFHIRGEKDTMHAFNSAVIAAKALPGLGFPINSKYPELIDPWSEYTRRAFIPTDKAVSPKPDNQKLPKILSDIDDLFGENTPASLITKVILLHISPSIDKNYPTPAPLTEDEFQRFVSPNLFPLLKVMMLADNEGWSLFDPEVRDQQKREALQAFEKLQNLIVMNK